MNQKLPYEQLIADKLGDIHLPGREGSWQKMKNLLDEEMPEINNDKKRGFGIWRNIGLLVFLITGAALITLYLSPSDKQVSAAAAIELQPSAQHTLPAEERIIREGNSDDVNPAPAADKNAQQLTSTNSHVKEFISEQEDNGKVVNRKEQTSEKAGEQLTQLSLTQNQRGSFKGENIFKKDKGPDRGLPLCITATNHYRMMPVKMKMQQLMHLARPLSKMPQPT